LVELQQKLKAASADTWSTKRWQSWFDSWKRFSAWKLVAKQLQEGKKTSTVPFEINAYLSGRPNGIVEVKYIYDMMKFPLFLESMRQQLWHHYLEHLGTLTCPFEKQSASCCGLGHCLRNIWEGIPKGIRGGFKLPSQVCLQHDPNRWLEKLLGQ
jgi:hypothetical protein